MGWWNHFSFRTLLYSFPNSSLSFADTSQSLHHPPPKYLIGDAYRRKVFFNYEKCIRMQSPSEKVFECFASFEADDGEIFMTPADLMRAVVPVFPPSESHLVRDGYLRGERSPGELQCAPSKFFMLFDTNSDGRVSFKEYIFFVTLLSIPESSFSVAFKMFDLDCNGFLFLVRLKSWQSCFPVDHGGAWIVSNTYGSTLGKGQKNI